MAADFKNLAHRREYWAKQRKAKKRPAYFPPPEGDWETMQEKDLSWARPDSIWQNPKILPSKDRAFMAGADVMFYAGKDHKWNNRSNEYLSCTNKYGWLAQQPEADPKFRSWAPKLEAPKHRAIAADTYVQDEDDILSSLEEPPATTEVNGRHQTEPPFNMREFLFQRTAQSKKEAEASYLAKTTAENERIRRKQQKDNARLAASKRDGQGLFVRLAEGSQTPSYAWVRQIKDINETRDVRAAQHGGRPRNGPKY
jgi:hypothetical protein